MRDDSYFNGGMRDKNISAGVSFTHFDREEVGCKAVNHRSDGRDGRETGRT